MKPTCRSFMLLAYTASLIFLLGEGALTFAQSTEPPFRVGDRVEADLLMFGLPIDQASSPSEIPQRARAWRKATITKVFEAKKQGSSPQKDSVVVAVADAVASQGTTQIIEASSLAVLNIPYAKTEGLAVKAVSMTQRLESGRNRIKWITVIVTDQRYILYSRALNTTIYPDDNGWVVDETGKVVGQTKDMAGSAAVVPWIAASDHVYWANILIPERVASSGVWDGKVSYRVKTDEGKEYTTAASHVRRLTEVAKEEEEEESTCHNSQ